VLRLIFAVQADTSAVGDVNGVVVKRIGEFRQAAIVARGGRVDFRGALHAQGLMRPLVVELLKKIIEFALLLQTVQACGASGLRFERRVHALMPARAVGQDLQTGFLVAVEDLVTGLARWRTRDTATPSSPHPANEPQNEHVPP
jgi:hypothetical protein